MPTFKFTTVRWAGWLLCVSASVATLGCGVTGGWVMNNSGMGYYQQGNYAMARNEFAQAVAANPWNPDYRHNLAMSLQKSGDGAHAERILRHNLTVDAMHQPTYHSLAKLMMESGRQPEAEELLTTWSGTQPYNPKAHVEMAWFQRETGNIPMAEQNLRQALQIDPSDTKAMAQLGQLYQDSGETDRAARLYQQSLQRDYQPQVESRLASLGRSPYGNQSYGFPAGPARMNMGFPMPGMANRDAANIAWAAGPPVFGGGNMMAGMPYQQFPTGAMSYPSDMSMAGGGMVMSGPVMTSSMMGSPAMMGAPTMTNAPMMAGAPMPGTLVPGVTMSNESGQWMPVSPSTSAPTPISNGLTPVPEQQWSAARPAMTGSTVPQWTAIPAMPAAEESQVIPAGRTVPATPGANWQPSAMTVPAATPLPQTSSVPVQMSGSEIELPALEAH